MKKIKELCQVFPRVDRDINLCDTAASNIFTNNKDEKTYIFSDSIEKRYGFDEKYISLENDNFKDFEKLGLNEKYIINHIFFSKNNILFLIGGIGIGKSSFLNLFKKQLEINKIHKCKDFCKHFKEGGIYIYIDFNKEKPASFSGDDSLLIHYDIVDRINVEIRDSINACGVFNFEEEITDVWDEILKEPHSRILKKIRNSLIEEDGYKITADFQTTIKTRRDIYKSIKADGSDLISYLVDILSFISAKKYQKNCVFIVFDNLDICSPVVQNCAKDIIIRYFYNSYLKSIVTVRQSTYLALFDTGFSLEAANTIGHKGPDIIKVILHHLNEATTNPNNSLEGIKCSDSLKNTYIDNLKKIIKIIEEEKTKVAKFIRSCCGNSIRKALIIARNLISNSAYDPFNSNAEITVGSIMRALIVGNDSSYSWSYDKEIDNLYHVDTHDDQAYLTKIRILKALSPTKVPDGLILAKIIDLMNGFGYSSGLIRQALNEMMSTTKRLIWTNTVQEFRSSIDFMEAKLSKVFISSSGLGYQSFLFKNANYFQEVTLDVVVDSNDFRKNLDYTRMADRIELIFKFLRILVEKDIQEMEFFLEKYSFKRYQQFWPDSTLITYELTTSIYNDFSHILKSSIEKDKAIGKYRTDDLYHVERFLNKEYSEITEKAKKAFNVFASNNGSRR